MLFRLELKFKAQYYENVFRYINRPTRAVGSQRVAGAENQYIYILIKNRRQVRKAYNEVETLTWIVVLKGIHFNIIQLGFVRILYTGKYSLRTKIKNTT